MGQGQDVSHLILFQREDRLARAFPALSAPSTVRAAPQEEEWGYGPLFLRVAREPSVCKWFPQQIWLQVFQTVFITQINTQEIRLSHLTTAKPWPLDLYWCSLDQGREVMMVMKMNVTTEASLAFYGLWSHTCPFCWTLIWGPWDTT